MEGFNQMESKFMNKWGEIISGIEFEGIDDETNGLHYIAPNKPCSNLTEYAIFSDAVKITYGLNGYEPRIVASLNEFCPITYLMIRPKFGAYFVYPTKKLVDAVKPGQFWISASDLDDEAAAYLSLLMGNSMDLICAFME